MNIQVQKYANSAGKVLEHLEFIMILIPVRKKLEY